MVAQGTSGLGVVHVATQGLVVAGLDLRGRLGEGGILVDGDVLSAAADLFAVTAAAVGALGGVQCLAAHRRAAVADAVVDESSIAESVG